MPSRPKHLNGDLVRSLPDSGPVVMVNLVRFREQSLDGDGAGQDAYQRYSRMVMPLIKARGGTVIWGGDGEGAAFGEVPGGAWDYLVLVQYPSRAAFLDMVTSPEYAEANIQRENGVADHVIIATTETYSKMSGNRT
jgi:uncharacterized protein (DUF1330 family)